MGGSLAPWVVGVGYLRGGTSSHESPFSLFIVFYFSHFFFTYFRYSHFFSTSKKKYIYIYFSTQFFLIKFLAFSLIFFNFHLSSLLFLLNNFFFLFTSLWFFFHWLLLISTFFLYLHLCFLRLTIPPLHTKCYKGGGGLTPCHEGEGEGEMVAWPS